MIAGRAWVGAIAAVVGAEVAGFDPVTKCGIDALRAGQALHALVFCRAAKSGTRVSVVSTDVVHACFDSITEVVVVTMIVLGALYALVGTFTTEGISTRRRAVFALVRCVADTRSVAEVAVVVTVSIVEAFDALVGVFFA